MTTQEIGKTLAHSGKRVSRAMIYRYLARLGIKPVGPDQRPQQYPATTGEAIKAHLGLAGNGNGQAQTLPTLNQLRTARKKARGR